jgi:hypothetical protein
MVLYSTSRKQSIMDQDLTENVNLNIRIPPDIHRDVKHRAVRARRMAEEAGD